MLFFRQIPLPMVLNADEELASASASMTIIIVLAAFACCSACALCSTARGQSESIEDAEGKNKEEEATKTAAMKATKAVLEGDSWAEPRKGKNAKKHLGKLGKHLGTGASDSSEEIISRTFSHGQAIRELRMSGGWQGMRLRHGGSSALQQSLAIMARKPRGQAIDLDELLAAETASGSQCSDNSIDIVQVPIRRVKSSVTTRELNGRKFAVKAAAADSVAEDSQSDEESEYEFLDSPVESPASSPSEGPDATPSKESDKIANTHPRMQPPIAIEGTNAQQLRAMRAVLKGEHPEEPHLKSAFNFVVNASPSLKKIKSANRRQCLDELQKNLEHRRQQTGIRRPTQEMEAKETPLADSSPDNGLRLSQEEISSLSPGARLRRAQQLRVAGRLTSQTAELFIKPEDGTSNASYAGSSRTRTKAALRAALEEPEDADSKASKRSSEDREESAGEGSAKSSGGEELAYDQKDSKNTKASKGSKELKELHQEPGDEGERKGSKGSKGAQGSKESEGE